MYELESLESVFSCVYEPTLMNWQRPKVDDAYWRFLHGSMAYAMRLDRHVHAHVHDLYRNMISIPKKGFAIFNASQVLFFCLLGVI